jgi:ATP-dependent Lon protease
MHQHNKKVEKLIDDVSKMKNIGSASKKPILDALDKMKLQIKLPRKIIYNDNKSEKESEQDPEKKNGEMSEMIEEEPDYVKYMVKNYSEELEEIIEEINELKKINKNQIVSSEFNRFEKEKDIPTISDIFLLKHVPYEEKRELINMINMFNECSHNGSYYDYKEMLSLREEIKFRYNNLKSIKKIKEKQRYKRAREVDYPTYNQILSLPDISDEGINYMIERLNNAVALVGRDYVSGISALKKTRYEILNGGYNVGSKIGVLQKISESTLPKEYKEKLYLMLSNLDNEEEKVEEPKINEFINQAVSIPFNKLKYNIPNTIGEFCSKFRNILDKELYGMDKIKEELITSVCCKAFTTNIKYKAIALVGPPGTGKTTIAKTIAMAFDIPFEQIPMNTISNGSDLTGHNYTYMGSQPGRIVKSLMKMKCNNGVLLLDEIDKVNDNSHDSAIKALMNICDFSQNHEFVDNYFQDFKIDLSNLLIICSLNDATKLGYVLADRVKIIQVHGYTKDEKIHICKKIIEKTAKELEINSNMIIINDDILEHLIDKDDEINKMSGNGENSGVRGLESILKHILERIKILSGINDNNNNFSYYIDDFKLPYTLTRNDANLLLLNYGTDGKGRMDVLEKINKSMLPNKNKQELRCILANTKEDNHDYNKIMDFIRLALSIPFNKIQYDIPNSTKELYTRFKKLLDESLYGMDKVKEELITTLCCKFKNPNSKYKAIALVGPPGTGKTTIARTIAKVFKVPFEQISINTLGDADDLIGHNYTYIGSNPGRIVKSLIKMGCNNGVLFLDEIDKLDGSSKKKGIEDAIMNILDFSQNNEFTDNYFQDIKIDLSNLLIVCSLNDVGKLDSILADRIKFIHVDGYTTDDKIKIGFNMKNKICSEYNISNDDIKISNAVMKYLIKQINDNEERIGKYEHGGVRGLESSLKHIFERLKILIDLEKDGEVLDSDISYNIKDFKLPYELKTTDIDLLLKNFMAKDNFPEAARSMFL